MNHEVVTEDVGHVRWITLDRPDCRNALTPDLVEHLAAQVREASAARVIGIAGRHGAFCAGLDLRFAAQMGPALLEQVDQHLAKFQSLARALADAPQIVVAAVDGPAAGFGCDLALLADLRIASERAYFQENFTRIGLLPDGGGTWLLPRLVGLSKALELALLGDRLDAATAKQLGLVSEVVPPEILIEEAREVAARLAAGPPLALQRIKRLMRDGMSRSFDDSLRAEGKAQAECLRSEDCLEGIQAFFTKRPPHFHGR